MPLYIGRITEKLTGRKIRYTYKDSWGIRYYNFTALCAADGWDTSKVKAYQIALSRAQLAYA